MSAEISTASTTEKVDSTPQSNGDFTKPAAESADASGKPEEEVADGKSVQTGEKRKAEE